MNKSDLINEIVRRTNLPKNQVDKFIKAYNGAIIDVVAAGDDVSLVGFGTFTAVERSAREGRNPATGKKIRIPASRSPRFKAGKNFKEAVKNKKK